ncbi:MAG: D-alanyl-D-alanine carboxypeptidase/D-alanyl-D-alanine-endopeptidase [Betaproteobacteria bacterium]|nr:D-alanyl-D-alanine carboxypeptidase/D-alanyl-D-alanine-endopeptidase [Betaproteobacteria bacterium]
MPCRPDLLIRLLFAAICALASCTFAADISTRLPPAVAEALAQAGIPEGSVGIYVQDTQASRPLLAIGEERAFNPASTIKLLTTFSALEQLGPAYQWTTEIYADGALDGDVLNGNLVMKGGGDPRLTLENFWLMLRNLRARGVREIRGDLVLDRSYFARDETDPAEFDNEPTRPYNTPPDALLVNFKALRLQFVPDTQRQALRILSEPALQQVQILNNVTLDNEPCGDWVNRLKLTALGDRASARLLFAGNYSIACGDKERNYSVLGHAQYVHGLFSLLWRELGGTFSGGVRDAVVPAGARLLVSHQTQSLAEIARDINKFSNNVMARQLYLALGAITLGAPASTEKSARSIKQWLTVQRLAMPELALENGSGLSRVERISAKSLAQLLLTAQHSAVMPEFIASLPLVAVDGTMKKRLTGADIAGQAHIKTGSLTGVRAIAGYVFDAKGRTLIVVCLINHPRAQSALAAQDALLTWAYRRP